MMGVMRRPATLQDLDFDLQCFILTGDRACAI